MNSPDSEIETLCAVLRDHVSHCLTIAGAHFACDFWCDQIRVDLRGMSAGQYRQLLVRTRIVTRELRFNPTLLQRYGARFIAEVVPHECAHLVAFEVYGPGIRPHGQEWQTIMREVFGRVPRVRHSFEVERPPRRQYAYRCACPERIHSLSVIRHKRVQSGGSRYLCQSCRAELISVPDT